MLIFIIIVIFVIRAEKIKGKQMKKNLIFLAAGIFLFSVASCSKEEPTPDNQNKNGNNQDTTEQSLSTDTVSVDFNTTFQIIDGFGFFGAYDVWWGSTMWDDSWGDKIIKDLGITIWRNEYYPPGTSGVSQDADWTKQEPVVKGLKAKADENGVDLKFIFSVWSPPADLKWQSSFSWAGDEQATRGPGNITTKNGGTLNPNKYGEYADWLKTGIQLYNDAGIDLYGLSLQNEPLFVEPYNSCTYTEAWYNQMVNAVVPLIKADYPDVKIYGSENMLEMEGKEENWPYFYHQAIRNNDTTSSLIDILAVHGYSNGVAPTSGSVLAQMWTNHLEQFTEPMNKRTWMTETSGYSDQWEKSGDTPGALNLGMDIYSGLVYGNINAWVWWQGSQLDGIGAYNLMKGNTAGKKYYVSKQYYRFIRPGAVRIKSISEDPDVFTAAFQHAENKTTTLILINSGKEDKNIILEGTDLPAAFTMYRTSVTENCIDLNEVKSGPDNHFKLPAESIVTLQAGGNPL